jgi:CheY-like chemotaxis protein
VTGVASVVVVDDSKTIRDLISLNLELEGYEVTTAEDAEACLDLVAEMATGGAPVPDLFCLDVVMPGMDGVQLTTRLKALPATAHVPVLIVSASAQQRDFEVARAAKADGYLTKPFDPDALLGEVARLVSGG